jgi:hypothetical protein
MMKKSLLTLCLVVGLAVLGLSLPTPAMAQQTQAWSGVCVADATGFGSGDVATIQGLQCLIANVFSIAITVIGFAGFVMMIVASFRWLVSGGNSKNTETARNTFTYAVIGLVVALSAFIVLNLISAFTGVTVIQQFKIQTETSDS